MRTKLTTFFRDTFSASNFRPVPVGTYEGFLLRLFFVVLVLTTIWNPIRFTEQPMPKGIASLFDISLLGTSSVFQAFRIVATTAAAAYAAGLLLPLSTSVLAACHIAYHTLYNSQGPTHHDHQMVSLVLLTQAAVLLFLSTYRLVKKRPFALPAGTTTNSLLLYAGQSAVAAVYVTSAITKLSKSNGLWLFKTHHFGKSLIKTDRQRLYSSLDYEKYGGAVPTAEWIINNPNLARLMFAGGFFAELLAFMVLCSRPWAFFIGMGLIIMHQMVERLMHLEFYENQWVAAIFLLGLPYWAGRILRKPRVAT